MCGHVGLCGQLEFKDEAVIKRMLILDYFRGPDSTGLASVRMNGDVKLAKIASHPIDFFDTGSFKSTLQGLGSKVLLGHNRAATRGKVNAVNAHPYEYDHIVGAHNGTLDIKSWKVLEDIIGYETDTDSQAIFASIAKVGIDETISNIEEGKTSQEGAWALVWYDSKEDSMNFLRNKHRPFWLAYDKEFKKVLWASEYPTIQNAVDMSATTYDLHETEEGYKFFATETDTLYSFDMKELREGYVEKPDGRRREIKGKEAAAFKPPFSNHSTGTQTSHHGTNGTGVRQTNHSGTNPTTTNHGQVHGTSDDRKVINLFGDRSNPTAGALTKAQFDRIAKYGCSWCGGDVEYEDVGYTVVERDENILCPSCSKNDHTEIFIEDFNRLAL